MSISILEANNPKFSWIIIKNPETPLTGKPFRNGVLFNTWVNQSSHCCYFYDSIKNPSFCEGNHSYLNTEAYSPLAYFSSIGESYRTILSNKDENDTTPAKITLKCICIKKNLLEHFCSFLEGISFSNVDLDIKEENNLQVFKVIIEGTSIRNTLLKAQIFCAYFITKQLPRTSITLDKSFVQKVLNYLEAYSEEQSLPYYIVNLFKVNYLTTPNLFNSFKPILSKCLPYFTFKFGNTLTVRKIWVQSVADLKQLEGDFVDYGAGHDFNYYPLSQKINDTSTYYVVEKDENAVERIKYKANKSEKKNISIHLNFSGVKDKLLPNSTVLLTEVLEHNDLKDVEGILQEILTTVNVSKVIITLPYKPFNKYYNVEDFRHEDHKWEYYPGVIDLGQIALTNGFKITSSFLGDIYSKEGEPECSPSIGFVLEVNRSEDP